MEPEIERVGKICVHCGAAFDTKGKYDAHYRREHQNKVRTSETNTVVRAENDRFKCMCGKEYDVYQSLVRHQKTCGAWQDRERAAAVDIEESDEETDSESTIFKAIE